MAADNDSSGNDADAGTVKTTEKHTSGADDAHPDTENYAKGNTPDTAYRTQGQPGGPNSWDNYLDEDDDGQPDDPGDPWGSTYPDAAESAGPGSGTSPGGQDNLQQHAPAAGGGAAPDQGAPAEAGTEQAPSAELERISSLETEHGETKHQLDESTQKIADLEARNAGLEAENAENREKIGNLEAGRADDKQEIADLKAQYADLAARMDRFEQPAASPDKSPDGAANTPDHGVQKPDSPHSPDPRDQSLAERQGTTQGADNKVAERSWWRRAASSDSLDMLQTLGGTGEAVAALAMNATPDGVAGLVLAGLGVAKIAMARYEKRKGKGKT